MNFSPPDGSGIAEHTAREILRNSNPLRDGWSNGDLYYELQGNRRARLIFHEFGNRWYDLRALDKKMKAVGY